MSVYVQSRNDDGGYVSRGLPALGDFAAVRPRSEFVEVLRPEAQSQPDVQTIRRGSMTSVPAVSGIHYIDTQSRRVHTLNVRLSVLDLKVDSSIGAAA